ncbi:MAG: putative sugar kinase YdjH [Lentisphaerae bacterium ADurb.Bin242]|nr:MAG: putative sugar kinase YdjH [Lentisphaerae bacterium ADurb.Bin242]
MSLKKSRILGFGSPILDLLLRVDDAFLARNVEGEKGGMRMLDAFSQRRLISAVSEVNVRKAIGGSAFNTISALTSLGFSTAFLGKLGNDADGTYFRETYAKMGGDASRFRISPTEPTATCLSMVTPDSERTMRTNLGASATLSPEDISDADFKGITHFHAEGYMCFLMKTLKKALKLAKKHHCTVSFDLASFEVVRLFRADLEEIFSAGCVDIVFANEDEARELCGPESFSPDRAAEKLAPFCTVVAVKLGKNGAFVTDRTVSCRIAPKSVQAVDTTGAGDLWQAGFLFGYLSGHGIEKAGKMGSLLGAEIVQVFGAEIPSGRWRGILSEFNNIKEQ